MRHIILALAFCVLLAVPCLAVDPAKVYDGWLYSGNSSSTSTGLNFTLFLDTTEAQVMLRFSFGSIFVTNGSCTTAHDLTACYLERQFGFTDPFRYDDRYGTTYTNWNRAHITMTSPLAVLNVSRSFENKELLPGKQTKAHVTIVNMGDTTATGVKYVDTYPNGLEVVLITPCTLNGNTVSWSGNLSPWQKKECSYILKTLAPGEYTGTLSVEYMNPFSKGTLIDSATIKVLEPLLRIGRSAPANITVGDAFVYNITLTALENLTIQFFRVTIPDELRILDTQGMQTVSYHQFSYKGSLLKGNSTSFAFTLIAEKGGRAMIEQGANYYGPEFIRDYLESVQINVTALSGSPYLRLSATSFQEGRSKLSIFIVNPANHTFRDLKVGVSSPLQFDLKDAAAAEVPPSTHAETVFWINASAGTYPLNLTLTYSTLYGEQFTVRSSHSITVAPPGSAAGNGSAGTAQQSGSQSDQPPGQASGGSEGTVPGISPQASQSGQMMPRNVNESLAEKGIRKIQEIAKAGGIYTLIGAAGTFVILTVVIYLITRRNRF